MRHALIVDINLKDVINGCHAALPRLRHTPDSRVINLASASAIYGTPGYASYSATKFAVRGLSEALNSYDIRVFDLLPRRCHVVESLMRVRRVSQQKSCGGDDFAPRLHG